MIDYVFAHGYAVSYGSYGAEMEGQTCEEHDAINKEWVDQNYLFVVINIDHNAQKQLDANYEQRFEEIISLIS